MDHADEDGRRVLNDANFRFGEGEKILVLSESGGARDVAAALLSRLCLPTSGSLQSR